MYKERGLTRKERESLKLLEKEVRDKQIDYNTALDKLLQEEANANSRATRRAADIVRDVNEVYQKNQRNVDKWRVAEMRRVEREYQKRLVDARACKRFACDWAEDEINTVKEKQEAYIDAERARLDADLKAFLAENRLKQENIKYGPPDERKKLKPEKKETVKEPERSETDVQSPASA